jgi:predicted DNA binding protein
MHELAIAKLSFDPFDIYNLGYEELFDHFEEIVVSKALIDSSKTFFVLAEVMWKGVPDMDLIKKFEFFEDVVEMSHEGNNYIYMAVGHHLPIYSEIIEVMTTEFHCFIEYPLVYNRDYVYEQVVGKRENLKKYMDFLTDMGVTFRVEYVKDYHIKGRALLSELTERQYECMRMAVQNGYFDIPRRANLRILAKKMKISHGAFSFHIRKAQRTINRALFG